MRKAVRRADDLSQEVSGDVLPERRTGRPAEDGIHGTKRQFNIELHGKTVQKWRTIYEQI